MLIDLEDVERKLAAKDRRNYFIANMNVTAPSGRLLWTPEMGRARGPMPGDPAYADIVSKAWQVNTASDAAEQYVNEVAWRGGTQLTVLYGGLYNDTPTDTDTESDLTGEPSGNGYARIAWNLNTTDFPTTTFANGNWSTLGIQKSYTASGGDIGPVTAFVLQESSSGTAGDIYIYITMASVTITDGESLNVTPAITVS